MIPVEVQYYLTEAILRSMERDKTSLNHNSETIREKFALFKKLKTSSEKSGMELLIPSYFLDTICNREVP